MKHKMFLLAVLLFGTYYLTAQEDPYLLWQTTDPLGYSGFVIHPNGNIIANRNAEIFELDGNTGQVIKTFPQFVHTNVEDMDVTKDGKILGAGFGNIILYDLENDKVIGGVSETNGLFAFFHDSKRFVARSTKLFPNNLLIYNLETKDRTEIGINYAVWSVATSPDGKYFATGGTGTEQVGLEEKDYTYLTLWDAETLKPIKQLDKIEGDNEVRSIKFSPDGKYVGFNGDFYEINIFSTENFNLIKNYSGAGAFCLFSDSLIGMYSTPGILIKDYLNNQKLFETSNISIGAFYFVEHNATNNTLVYGGGILRALDLNKVLTSVSEPTYNTMLVNYTKGSLILTGLNSISGQINITISDISSRVVRKLNSLVSNSELRIPLNLPNGTYLIHIQDGNQEFTAKFLVVE